MNEHNREEAETLKKLVAELKKFMPEINKLVDESVAGTEHFNPLNMYMHAAVFFSGMVLQNFARKACQLPEDSMNAAKADLEKQLESVHQRLRNFVGLTEEDGEEIGRV